MGDNRAMTAPIAHSSRRSGALLLADISGYTGFLQGVADAHRDIIVEADEPPAAYSVLSHLLDAIVGSVGPVFRLVKFEGDAVFAVADDAENPIPHGEAALACLRACYEAFARELARAGSQWTCSCAACSRVGDLDLKFVLHDGSFVVQSIAGHDELLGPDVNLVHRLLKNHARELIGSAAYALITDAAAQRLEVPLDGMIAGEEAYEDTRPVAVHLLVLSSGPARPAGAEGTSGTPSDSSRSFGEMAPIRFG